MTTARHARASIPGRPAARHGRPRTRTITRVITLIILLALTGLAGALITSLAPALAATAPPDTVSVHYAGNDLIRLVITNDSGHAVDDPGVNLYHGHAWAWADDNRVVPAGGRFTVTLRLADGTWTLGTVDSIGITDGQPNPDTEYSSYAVRWNGSHEIIVHYSFRPVGTNPPAGHDPLV